MGKSNKNVANGNAATSSEMEDGNACFDYVWDDDPSSPLLSPGKVNQTGQVPAEWLSLILWKSENYLLDFSSPEGSVALLSAKLTQPVLFLMLMTLSILEMFFKVA